VQREGNRRFEELRGADPIYVVKKRVGKGKKIKGNKKKRRTKMGKDNYRAEKSESQGIIRKKEPRFNESPRNGKGRKGLGEISGFRGIGARSSRGDGGGIDHTRAHHEGAFGGSIVKKKSPEKRERDHCLPGGWEVEVRRGGRSLAQTIYAGRKGGVQLPWFKRRYYGEERNPSPEGMTGEKEERGKEKDHASHRGPIGMKRKKET